MVKYPRSFVPITLDTAVTLLLAEINSHLFHTGLRTHFCRAVP
jgi:hypothetical protein